MNKKNSNAWILCPSKSYPGKFYYFNVITGEAAWCLTEEEKKELAKVAIKKVSDKSHSFPEPNTPPTEDGPDTSNICYNLNPQTNLPIGYHMRPPQIFGQPVFSKYIPNQYMPGYVIPMPQMFLASNLEPKKRSFDQITQTSDVQVPCIQGYTIPLSKRFVSYRQFKSGTKTFDNKGININKGDILDSSKGNWFNADSSELNFNTFNSSVFGSKLNSDKIKVKTSDHNPFNSNINTLNKTNSTRIIRDPILTSINRKENTNVHNFIINTGIKATDAIKKPTLILETKTKIKNNQVAENSDMSKDTEPSFIKSAHNSQNTNVIKHNWIQNTMFDNILKQPIQNLTNSDAMVSSINEMYKTEDNIDNTLEYLNSNDLRFVLEAKRRKLKIGDVDTQVKTKDMFSSTIYLNKDLIEVNKKVKQVTFDLGLKEIEKDVENQTLGECEVHTPDSENVDETDTLTPQVINTTYLKSLANSVKKTNPWYVVVDIGVLLDDFEFIEAFVTKDTTCRLLVPNSVRSYIETMSVGEYGGRAWVMLARKAMRRLASTEKHIVVQPPIMETSSSSAIDGTVECCLQALESNHAVLITTDTELYNKGISSGINTFKLDDVKKSIENEPEDSFNMNINIQIENDNIFTQNADNVEGFPSRKNDTCKPVNDSDIFKVPAAVKNSRKYIENNKVCCMKPMTFNKSNVVDDSISSKKIQLIRKWSKDNVTCYQHTCSNIEDNIKLLSLHDNKPQNSKLCENLQGVSQIHGGMNIRKVIINTNIQNNEYKDEKNLKTSEADHRREIFEELDINPNGIGKKPPETSTRSEYGIKINPLTVTVPGRQQNTNSSIKGGSRLKINAYTLEDSLKRFQVKDTCMYQRIESRLDEWVCCFSQILEECFSDILMRNTQGTKNKLSAPWTLLEAALCLKEMYSNNTAIRTIADKLCSTLSYLSDKNDNLKCKMKSADFTRLFGCGALMVESLKSELPQSAQVLESEKLLNSLFHHIKDPSTDIDLPFTPMRIVRSEIDDMESMKRNVVPKKPAEIIGYLKIHFPAWKDFDEKLAGDTNTQEIDLHNERTVLRTFGKNLNSIRINKAKRITFDDIAAHNTNEFKEHFGINVHTELPNITRTIENKPKDAEKKNTKAKCHNDFNKENNKTSTKLLKNSKETVNSICKDSVDEGDYEECALEIDNLAEDVMIDGDDNAMPFDDDKMKSYDVIQIDDEMSLFEKVDDEIKSKDKENCYDSTNDSGYVNQSLDACSFLKLFLTDLSASFKLIYTFIEDSIQVFRCNMVELKDKKVLYDKANETHLYIADIIGKLKRIIDREANENTKLKSLIINAGVEALTDKRITRYRQVIMKCLEQAQLLEGALKTMLALTNEHCDITTIDIDDVPCHMPYFNIFE